MQATTECVCPSGTAYKVFSDPHALEMELGPAYEAVSAPRFSYPARSELFGDSLRVEMCRYLVAGSKTNHLQEIGSQNAAQNSGQGIVIVYLLGLLQPPPQQSRFRI